MAAASNNNIELSSSSSSSAIDDDDDVHSTYDHTGECAVSPDMDPQTPRTDGTYRSAVDGSSNNRATVQDDHGNDIDGKGGFVLTPPKQPRDDCNIETDLSNW